MKRSLLIALCGASVLIVLQPVRHWLEHTPAAGEQASDQTALHSHHATPIDTHQYNTLLAQACRRESQCDEPARLLSGNTPRYPPLAHAQGRNGHALMRFAILADGSTASILALSSSEPAFSQAASEAIAGWRLEPARFKGKPQPQASIDLQFVVHP